jgi:hypothetical protein
MAKKRRKTAATKRKKKTAAANRRKTVRTKSRAVARRKAAPKAKRKGVIATITGAAAAVVATLTDAEQLHHKLEPHVSPDPE